MEFRILLIRKIGLVWLQNFMTMDFEELIQYVLILPEFSEEEKIYIKIRISQNLKLKAFHSALKKELGFLYLQGEKGNG